MKAHKFALVLSGIFLLAGCIATSADYPRAYNAFDVAQPGREICLKMAWPQRPMSLGEVMFGSNPGDREGMELPLEAGLTDRGFKVNCSGGSYYDLVVSYDAEKYTHGQGWLVDKLMPQVVWSATLRNPRTGYLVAQDGGIEDGVLEKVSTTVKNRVFTFVDRAYLN